MCFIAINFPVRTASHRLFFQIFLYPSSLSPLRTQITITHIRALEVVPQHVDALFIFSQFFFFFSCFSFWVVSIAVLYTILFSLLSCFIQLNPSVHFFFFFLISDIVVFVSKKLSLVAFLELACLDVSPLASWSYGIVIIVLMCWSTNSLSFLGWFDWFFLLWVVFPCPFAGFIIFDWMPDIMHCALVGAGYFLCIVLFWNVFKLLGYSFILSDLVVKCLVGSMSVGFIFVH